MLPHHLRFGAVTTSGPGEIRIGTDRWNHNIHYGLQVLAHVPETANDALDVGSGEGWMVRELSKRVPRVVGLDPDKASLTEACSHRIAEGTHYVQGDLLICPFPPNSFDVITCIAALHHTDEEAGMRHMAELLRPGGTLAVVGLGRSRTPRDIVWDIGGAIATRVHKLSRHDWETPAPKIWPPPHTYGEIRRLSANVLPGSTFRRVAMWRYVLTWTKPSSG